ncbi:hypothetical protein GGTG_04588 [Gaeumannomyces tritici R3-111a-1]|uniref:Uncharacterized protein n=1 Tax=Gaeumannomyces tritici (strain R3-111a-1) TaxID=644352 RepID=J3NTI8_GAET3|nr:hypothetical protein GGTG_04588 [Gaeumannomyces tritici R3-111a-1]EJT79504.1 hypothetical protein GGTG_04588 [Gaeumannomyces tritici R3-111a-1]
MSASSSGLKPRLLSTDDDQQQLAAAGATKAAKISLQLDDIALSPRYSYGGVRQKFSPWGRSLPRRGRGPGAAQGQA